LDCGDVPSAAQVVYAAGILRSTEIKQTPGSKNLTTREDDHAAAKLDLRCCCCTYRHTDDGWCCSGDRRREVSELEGRMGAVGPAQLHA
jgi:hypothetical protein